MLFLVHLDVHEFTHRFSAGVTLLVAYLMKYEKMSALEATELIQETRPIAAPYYDDLDLYNEQYVMPVKVENKTDREMEILG